MSSTAPSPQRQFVSGSSRELPGPTSQNPGAGMKLGHHGGTPLGHGGVAAPSRKIEMTHQTTPRSVTARAKARRRERFPRRAPTATQTSIRTIQSPGMNSQSRKPLLAALFTPTSQAVHDLPRSMAADTARSRATARPRNPHAAVGSPQAPVRRPLREAPDPHLSSLPHPASPPALTDREQTPLDPSNHMIRRTVSRAVNSRPAYSLPTTSAETRTRSGDACPRTRAPAMTPVLTVATVAPRHRDATHSAAMRLTVPVHRHATPGQPPGNRECWSTAFAVQRADSLRSTRERCQRAPRRVR